MSDTARLRLPFLAAAQAQKHVTVNEALARLDGLVQAGVLSRALADPPADPGEGDAYLVAAGGSGAWTGMDGRLAVRFAGGWTFHEAAEGWLVHVADEGRFLVRSGGAWRDLAEAAVWHPAGTGFQAKISKPAEGDVAALLLQTGWSGRAEIGLVGDDDLSVKVSADGAMWSEAMRVDRTTGRAAFALGALRTETTVFEASAAWSPPPWARLVQVIAVGGGGGGGSGRVRTIVADRRGGNGGGGAGYARFLFRVEDLPPTVNVVVGAAGPGGAAATAPDSDGVTGGTGGGSGLFDGTDWLFHAAGGPGGPGGRAPSASATPGGRGDVGPGGTGSMGGSSHAGNAVDPVYSFAPGGGGGGGGILTNNDIGNGGSGATGSNVAGPGSRRSLGGIGAGQTGNAGPHGGAGAGKGWLYGAGGGGGGGLAGDPAGTVSGGHGGAGGVPGGGGGGGGGVNNGASSGKGGDGGRGEVILIAIG